MLGRPVNQVLHPLKVLKVVVGGIVKDEGRHRAIVSPGRQWEEIAHSCLKVRFSQRTGIDHEALVGVAHHGESFREGKVLVPSLDHLIDLVKGGVLLRGALRTEQVTQPGSEVEGFIDPERIVPTATPKQDGDRGLPDSHMGYVILDGPSIGILA